MPASAGTAETAAPVDAPQSDADQSHAELGPETPGRLVIQRVLFHGPTPLVPADLYAQVTRGSARRDRLRVAVAPGSHVTTNTYFGRIHATYWQRWTDVTEMEVSLLVSGSGSIRLHASDTNKIDRVVDAQAVRGVDGAVVVLRAAVDRFVDGGGLWLEFATDDSALEVSDVRWTVDSARPTRSASMVICTYNRVDDCLNTLEALANDTEPLECLRRVHVVDQGSDPLESRERFAEIAGRFGDKLDYIRQPNLGGAGGFTRGIYEVVGEQATDADVLLMDDDVQLEPEIVIRLTAFANRTTTPTIVGGQMLNLLHPTHLHIGAEWADIEDLTVGKPMPGTYRDKDLLALDEEGLPTVQDRRVDTEYNGWWSCLIPAEIVGAIGYPLPLFFQWDDIEFGYRARQQGFPTVALPGAGVWHADFGWKDWDEWHRFFNIRNGLITAALRTDFSVKRIGSRLATSLAHYTIAMQYGLATTLLEAVEEFLNGPEILQDGSAAAAARIREIRSAFPETKMHQVKDIDVDFRDMTVVRSPGEPGMPRMTWLKRAVYQALDRPMHRTGLVPAGDAHWWHVSLFERAVVTDMSELGVRIRTRDRALALEIAKRGARALRRLQKEAPELVERYRAAQPELTSRENWARLYGLDDKA
ncbi:MAG: glycosyltransferase [Pseudonocardia sp.]|uniref:glycosyltransferase n=1 Tax=unclassified Pseudonocardia TaxID=2619320 RepID=UPI0008699B08|nr:MULTISPECIES: glycosyltransferase [unclassified Pseudonocardia]MBN9109901.1 glycosyltransferase [Pseudonocardia sp.]ODU23994.1 MAG: glycosyl transferase [Pseudonocardia sp. SCN 72-51]ODV02111.1 MAG: glycosyl transferase [Pseudonocardia sp. SCN 73-27]